MTKIDNQNNINKVIMHPKICCIDLNDEFVYKLKEAGFNIHKATLGTNVIIPNNQSSDSYTLLTNHNFPENLHEFEIVIVDLDYNGKTTDYKAKDHIIEKHTAIKAKYFFSSYPQSVFDPRPYSSSILRKQLDQITNRKYLIVVFASQSYNIVYQFVIVSEGGRKEIGTKEEHNIYGFNSNFPLHVTKSGNEISVCDSHNNQEL